MEKMDNFEDVTAEYIRNVQKEFLHLENLDGFSFYREFRSAIFNIIRQIIENNDLQKVEALSCAANFMNDQFDIFFEAGFFNEGYKHNFILSSEIFTNYFKDKRKINELLNIVDLYVKPKSEKTQDFKNSFYKGSSALMAYMLSQYPSCSEHLALLITKQVFAYKSDQTAYEELNRLKQYLSQGKKIPTSAKLVLFWILFSKSIDWNSLKPRAKQGRSISELKEGLQCLSNLREDILSEELGSAQNALRNHPEQFENIIKPEFFDKILNFQNGCIEIDDEMTCAVLYASFFGNKITAALISG